MNVESLFRMDEQCNYLLNSIVCAQSVETDPVSVQRRNEATAYINNLRNDSGSWKVALQAFLHCDNVREGVGMNEQYRVMLTCLDIITSFIRDGSYAPIPSEDKLILHDMLLNWVQSMSAEQIAAIPDYLKTKYSVLIALLIKMDYPQLWPNVFEVGCVCDVFRRRCSRCARCLRRTC